MLEKIVYKIDEKFLIILKNICTIDGTKLSICKDSNSSLKLEFVDIIKNDKTISYLRGIHENNYNLILKNKKYTFEFYNFIVTLLNTDNNLFIFGNENSKIIINEIKKKKRVKFI